MPSVALLLPIISQANVLSLSLHAFQRVKDLCRQDSFSKRSTGQYPFIHLIVEEAYLMFSSGEASTQSVGASSTRGIPCSSFESYQLRDIPDIGQPIHPTKVD